MSENVSIPFPCSDHDSRNRLTADNTGVFFGGGLAHVLNTEDEGGDASYGSGEGFFGFFVVLFELGYLNIFFGHFVCEDFTKV